MKDKNNTTKKEEQSVSEHAINHEETGGKQVNNQVKQKRETHQPRDNA